MHFYILVLLLLFGATALKYILASSTIYKLLFLSTAVLLQHSSSHPANFDHSIKSP